MANASRARLALYVQPRASRTEVAGVHAGDLKIRLAAPPVDGAANAALLVFVADLLGVPRRAVTLVHGATGRRKVVEIEGVTAEQLADTVSRIVLQSRA